MWSLLFGVLGCQLTATSLYIDASSQANGARNTIFFQNSAEELRLLSSGGLPFVLSCRIEQDDVDMA